MSCNYADGLSPYEYKGEVGMQEVFDSPEELKKKITILAKWIKESKYTVFHTGAGISTSAGIPDFRGPKGVWTLEKEGKKPEVNLDFDDAKPTITHMAINSLVKQGYIKYVVSQNIDGLHLKSGLPRKLLSEVHGNMFTMKCDKCKRNFVSKTAVKTVGQRCLGIKCYGANKNGHQCRGILFDTILDWEHQLPDEELELAELHSKMADLCICLGTSLQIQPINLVPFNAKKNKGKVIICNLQKTKCDRKADLVIHTYVDDLMKSLMEILQLDIDQYDELNDPTKIINKITDWTIYDNNIIEIREMRKNALRNKKRKKSMVKIINDPVNGLNGNHDKQILTLSKISKLNNFDNIMICKSQMLELTIKSFENCLVLYFYQIVYSTVFYFEWLHIKL
ncbi:NAD-dependent protein deacetylase Sirt6 [Daktulosphaira vitifoliae]|uniref:NAD-dependent protein deacetylase Sirt6 n=1 Tax=Daktulosphaira vitifoliae TaxID=58002 RepID=UPI0021AA7779|nr:NAD-dependent protein deacetylase Sirt6 [Daktulosphaira vitifoliae]XP_050531066.1 NAD-dependent protein deacetylase Sirt6 [Daktulosphaira vitifoliae]XP_050531068.1 NAD-dependent protein deacetylase Sirt6 [Daktulosphaira vitifoliae]